MSVRRRLIRRCAYGRYPVEFLLTLKRKIAIVTSSRADYAHVRWLVDDLSQNSKVDLQLIALGPHLSPLFGHTGNNITGGKARPGRTLFRVEHIECLLDSDT